MDALSEVLRLARFSAGVTLDATARAPWCVSIPASASMARAHVVIDGKCVVKTAGGEAVELKSGEMAFLAHGDAHLVGSSLDVDAKSLSALVKAPLAGELVPVSLGGDGEGTRWIVLTSSCERHLADRSCPRCRPSFAWTSTTPRRSIGSPTRWDSRCRRAPRPRWARAPNAPASRSW
jgi:hypothetical protein